MNASNVNPPPSTEGFDDNSVVSTVVTTEKVNWTLIALIIMIVVFAGYAWYVNRPADDVKKDEDTVESTVDDDEAGDEGSPTNAEDDEHADPAGDPGDDAPQQEFVDDAPVAVAIPDNWKSVVNTTQGYTAHRPNNFYYRIFSGNLLGIDLNPIPTQSEYAGMITLFASSDSLAVEVDRAKDIIDSETVETVTYANGDWTVVTGLVPSNEMFDERLAYYAITEVEGQTYLVSYLAAGESSYNQYIETAKNFTEYIVWEILDEA